jgi:hypothetical protein
LELRTFLAGALLAIPWTAGTYAPAGAAARPGSWEKELYFGVYVPEPRQLDSVGIVGMRAQWVVTRAFSLSGDLGFINRTEVAFDIAPPDTTGLLEYDALLLDAALRWSPIRLERWVFSTFAGPGWTFVSARVRASVGGRPDEVVDGLENDSFTASGGVSAKWYFGQGFYLLGSGRLRWLEARQGEDVDQELTLALGL